MTADFSRMRRNMVDCQIRTSDVTAPDLISAFLEVPREEFVPESLESLSYLDDELPIGRGRYMIAPAALAKLLQAASIQPDDHVLDIGCGAGYSTAILSRLASSLVAVENDPQFVAEASARLSSLGYGNAVVVEGSHAEGLAAEGPYDVIMVCGVMGREPEALLRQLKVGGRLVGVMEEGGAAMARLWFNDDGNVSSRRLFNCRIPAMPGLEQHPEFVF